MPAGENLGNAAVFGGLGGGIVPMPGFDPGMVPAAPSPGEIQRKLKEERDRQLAEQSRQSRDQAINMPFNYQRPQPLVLDINAVEGGLESIGGVANIELDKNQKLTLGGTYMPGYSEQGVPVDMSYRVEAGYSTPSMGINVNYRPRRNMGYGMSGGGLGAGLNLRQSF
jgi:hypothetical protein